MAGAEVNTWARRFAGSPIETDSPTRYIWARAPGRLETNAL
jgi:hypothetical protein